MPGDWTEDGVLRLAEKEVVGTNLEQASWHPGNFPLICHHRPLRLCILIQAPFSSGIIVVLNPHTTTFQLWISECSKEKLFI